MIFNPFFLSGGTGVGVGRLDKLETVDAVDTVDALRDIDGIRGIEGGLSVLSCTEGDEWDECGVPILVTLLALTLFFNVCL